MSAFADKRINEALDLLNDVARDKKEELRAAMENKYADLSSVVESFTNGVKQRSAEQFAAGKEKVSEMAGELDKSVRKNPWIYVGGAAAAALIFGFLMGRSRRD